MLFAREKKRHKVAWLAIKSFFISLVLVQLQYLLVLFCTSSSVFLPLITWSRLSRGQWRRPLPWGRRSWCPCPRSPCLTPSCSPRTLGTRARGTRMMTPPPGCRGDSDTPWAPSWGCRGSRCQSGCCRSGRRRRGPPKSLSAGIGAGRAGAEVSETGSCLPDACGGWRPPARPRPCPGASPRSGDLNRDDN